MRNFFSLVLSFFIIMASVPAVSLFYKDKVHIESATSAPTSTSTGTPTSTAAQTEPVSSEPTRATPAGESDKVRVYLHAQKKVVSVTREFYLISVMAKEIDIASPVQALKAQAVCINTFLERTRTLLKEQKKNYDITDDPAHHQSFLTKRELKKFWGESYQTNYRKLQKIAAQMRGIYLTYQGKPILAAYHSSNAGRSESAQNYWGQAYDYLVPAVSIGDTLCSAYANEVVFTPKALKKALLNYKNKTFSFAESPSDWIGNTDLSPSQTVLNITIAGASLTGREVREALSLKSSFFTVRYQNNRFIFTVSGYGHGVGMSQEGAKYMAKLGFSYKEILLHYYNGVAINGENEV